MYEPDQKFGTTRCVTNFEHKGTKGTKKEKKAESKCSIRVIRRNRG